MGSEEQRQHYDQAMRVCDAAGDYIDRSGRLGEQARRDKLKDEVAKLRHLEHAMVASREVEIEQSQALVSPEMTSTFRLTGPSHREIMENGPVLPGERPSELP